MQPPPAPAKPSGEPTMTTRRDFLAGAATAVVPLVLGQPAAAHPGHAPKEVFAVNTQDASVSRVDLGTMKEVKRYPVGPRPYGIAVTGDGKTVAVGVEDEEKVKFFDA